jgi:hypothetical protein
MLTFMCSSLRNGNYDDSKGMRRGWNKADKNCHENKAGKENGKWKPSAKWA